MLLVEHNSSTTHAIDWSCSLSIPPAAPRHQVVSFVSVIRIAPDRSSSIFFEVSKVALWEYIRASNRQISRIESMAEGEARLIDWFAFLLISCTDVASSRRLIRIARRCGVGVWRIYEYT